MIEQNEAAGKTVKRIDLNRREMPKQAPDVRVNNFHEVALGYAVETAVEEAKLPAVPETRLCAQLPGGDRYSRVHCCHCRA
jgi:hypothetical protein